MSRRTALLGALIAAAALALTACQPSAGTAAYVGSRRVTDDQLRTDLTSALAEPRLKDGVTKQYGSDLATYRRQLLNDRVRHELVAEAAARTGVQVSAADVQRLITNDGGFDRLRDDAHWSHDLAVRHYTDLLLTTELGYTQQHVKRPSEADLRTSYEQAKANQTQLMLGLIQVPDQKTLNGVIAQLAADPGRYDAIAAQYPGSAPQPAAYTPANIPANIRDKLLSAAPGAVVPFVGVGPNGEGQYLAVKVFSVKVPSFEDLRVQLSLPSLSEAYQAGQAYLATLAKQVGVRVSPRYGTWNARTAQIDEAPNPLLTLQPTPTPTPSASAAPSGP